MTKLSFKVPGAMPPEPKLRRISWINRTVRYELRGTDEEGRSLFMYCEPFFATVLEWERAHD